MQEEQKKYLKKSNKVGTLLLYDIKIYYKRKVNKSLVVNANRQTDNVREYTVKKTDTNMPYLIKVIFQPVGEKLSDK